MAAGWLLMPETVMPSWIGNWRLGGWGEENTASELKRLKKAGWTIRHDLATSGKANIDHFVVGRSAYVLDTKNLINSTVTVEAEALRVTRLDDPDSSYLLDRFGVRGQARRMERAIDQSLGFPVQVVPVLVIWGDFKEREAWLGNLAVVHGMQLAAWLDARPTTLVREDKRQLLVSWAEHLRSA
jgi:hypothetical protein